jgi:hypothetical protein
MLFLIWALAGLVGLVLALVRGGSWRRAGVLASAGICLGLAWLILGYLASTPSDKPRDCSDCVDYLGRWWEPGFALFVIGLAALAWVSGVLVGTGIRPALRKLF